MRIILGSGFSRLGSGFSRLGSGFSRLSPDFDLDSPDFLPTSIWILDFIFFFVQGSSSSLFTVLKRLRADRPIATMPKGHRTSAETVRENAGLQCPCGRVPVHSCGGGAIGSEEVNPPWRGQRMCIVAIRAVEATKKRPLLRKNTRVAAGCAGRQPHDLWRLHAAGAHDDAQLHLSVPSYLALCSCRQRTRWIQS